MLTDDAADGVEPLDERDLLPQLGRLDRRFLPGRAGADDDQVVVAAHGVRMTSDGGAGSSRDRGVRPRGSWPGCSPPPASPPRGLRRARPRWATTCPRERHRSPSGRPAVSARPAKAAIADLADSRNLSGTRARARRGADRDRPRRRRRRAARSRLNLNPGVPHIPLHYPRSTRPRSPPLVRPGRAPRRASTVRRRRVAAFSIAAVGPVRDRLGARWTRCWHRVELGVERRAHGPRSSLPSVFAEQDPGCRSWRFRPSELAMRRWSCPSSPRPRSSYAAR